jgi:hypothetical protein
VHISSRIGFRFRARLFRYGVWRDAVGVMPHSAWVWHRMIVDVGIPWRRLRSRMHISTECLRNKRVGPTTSSARLSSLAIVDVEGMEGMDPIPACADLAFKWNC